MTLTKKLIALGFAALLAMSVAACDVEEDPDAVPETSAGKVESVF